LKAPVGLISSAVGGTPIEAWTPPASYQSDPDLSADKAAIEQDDKNLPGAREAYKNKLDQWRTTTQAIAATQPGAKLPAMPPAPMSGREKYGGLYNGMVAGLTQYAIGGVIWYQGEANASNAAAYRKQFPAMIRGWRQAWGSEFPFLFAQLANFMPRKADPNAKSGWAELREAQTMALSLPKTGMAVIIDAGDAANIHPKDKQTVGKRLALAGLAVAYGKKDVVWQGPMFESMKSDGARLIVRFKNADGGLVNKGDKVEGFAVAGADGKYSPADARIEGDSATLTSADVAKPVAVRLMWADNPKCSLYNKADLPACPFRAGEENFAPATK
jgi:sialate O-acetylesterase